MEPTNLQIFVAEVKGTGESDYIGVYKQVPLRLRADVLQKLKHFRDDVKDSKNLPKSGY